MEVYGVDVPPTYQIVINQHTVTALNLLTFGVPSDLGSRPWMDPCTHFT